MCIRDSAGIEGEPQVRDIGARTGLLEDEARRAGYDAVSHMDRVPDHKAYYPGAEPLSIAIIGDRASDRLLGGQIVGHWRAEVSKRIDILAMALYHRMRVDELNDLDLSYAPPFSSPWDPVQMGAQAWSKAVDAARRTE